MCHCVENHGAAIAPAPDALPCRIKLRIAGKQLIERRHLIRKFHFPKLVPNRGLKIAVTARSAAVVDHEYRDPTASKQLVKQAALVWFIEDRAISPRSATDMARHYSHSFYVLFTLANVTKTPPEGLRAVYKVAQALPNNQEIFKALAENPSTPLDTLEDMMHSGAKHLERFAFRNPRLPKSEKIDFLSRASISNSASDRALAASEGDTPVSALRKLATDRDPGVILGLIGNASTPEDVLQRFTRSEYVAFRSGAESQLVRRRESQATTK